MTYVILQRLLTYGLFLSALTSCSQVNLYKALPSRLENEAQVLGFQDIRAWGDKQSSAMEKSAQDALQQELKVYGNHLPSSINALALSGGGADGAFGAGLLYGWTKQGTRPEFKLVSGISTGALIAPFAFLGPKYDERLKELYTSLADENIYELKNPLAIAFTYIKPVLSPSAANNKPLEKLIKKIVNQKMLDAIAREHLKGRRLLIGTTQLNAQRLVIWDIGAIAVSSNPNRLALFHKILLASSALPGFFPPQYFTMAYKGKIYKEMHVDGGVETQVMLFENAITPFARVSHDSQQNIERHLYIIRNLKVFPEWDNVNPQLHNIASRVIATLTKTQGIGDLYRIYVYCKRDNIDYNLAFIPSYFEEKPKSMFDHHYMRKLFHEGYLLGKKGYKWNKYPPNFNENS
ncbi:lipoprotein [Legionella beliardensis]|uniref:Lipoprotein n=1 Tax=Legionella beliardensis TaxID=91822 RepID=A0A378I1J9_9GAMM|nr:patatin-like phospholipase family protein [Legionella beliardensis]STX28555.1 lipoprotein [Legionella beliardensis]